MNSRIPKTRSFNGIIPAALASLLIASSLLLSVSLANGQNPDFSINANPSSLCVNPGVDAQSAVSISSLGGFSGTVNLSQSLSPSYSNGPTVSSVPSGVDLSSGQTVNFNITMTTTSSTPVATYTISIFGFSGSAYHFENIELNVNTGCSVGGSIVSTATGVTGSSLVLGIAIAGLVGLAASGLVVYVSRGKRRSEL